MNPCVKINTIYMDSASAKISTELSISGHFRSLFERKGATEIYRLVGGSSEYITSKTVEGEY